MRYKAYPDENGNYATVFELRAGVFKDGVYAVKAITLVIMKKHLYK